MFWTPSCLLTPTWSEQTQSKPAHFYSRLRFNSRASFISHGLTPRITCYIPITQLCPDCPHYSNWHQTLELWWWSPIQNLSVKLDQNLVCVKLKVSDCRCSMEAWWDDTHQKFLCHENQNITNFSLICSDDSTQVVWVEVWNKCPLECSSYSYLPLNQLRTQYLSIVYNSN